MSHGSDTPLVPEPLRRAAALRLGPGSGWSQPAAGRRGSAAGWPQPVAGQPRLAVGQLQPGAGGRNRRRGGWSSRDRGRGRGDFARLHRNFAPLLLLHFVPGACFHVRLGRSGPTGPDPRRLRDGRRRRRPAADGCRTAGTFAALRSRELPCRAHPPHCERPAQGCRESGRRCGCRSTGGARCGAGPPPDAPCGRPRHRT